MDNLPDAPRIIEGGFAIDDRGQITFANGFALGKVRRFYMVENFSTQTVRAFHGHRREEKFVFVVHGSALVAAVRIDDSIRPSREAQPCRFVLSDRQPRILQIPAGFANGFRVLEPGTKILFFSTATLEESKADDCRFPFDYWGEQVWKVEPR